jgi:predicted PurR-regulated permease PerM
MNWVITIVTITLASGFATMFNIRKQNRNSWGDIKDGYESIWFASLIINLFIGFVVGIFAVALRWAVPYIIAVAIGIFLLCIVFSGIILNNDNAKSYCFLQHLL